MNIRQHVERKHDVKLFADFFTLKIGLTNTNILEGLAFLCGHLACDPGNVQRKYRLATMRDLLRKETSRASGIQGCTPVVTAKFPHGINDGFIAMLFWRRVEGETHLIKIERRATSHSFLRDFPKVCQPVQGVPRERAQANLFEASK